MDPARITEVFAMHGNEMSWESHLRVVEHIATWPVEEIVDFQDCLLDHLARGTWMRTSVNRLVTLSGGSVTDPSLMGKEYYDALVQAGLEQSELGRLRRRLDEMSAAITTDLPPLVPEGSIGLPLHPWSGLPVRRLAGDELADSAMIRRARRAWVIACSTVEIGEVSWVLRAAPWAYRRVVGQRMAGVGPNRDEERWAATEPPTPWGGRFVLARKTELVEVFRLATVVNADEASIELRDYFDSLVRKLKARIVSSEWLRVGGQFEPGKGWIDGQIVWSKPGQAPIESEPSQLLVDILRTVQTPKQDRHVRGMADDEFWRLIGILEGDPRSDRWAQLVDELTTKTPAKIRGFAETLAAKLFAIDRPDLPATDSTGLGYSADVHLHLRCAVVIGGPEVWMSALTESVSETLLADGLGEQLLFVADDAYGRRTGGQLDLETALSYETGSNLKAWGKEPDGAIIEAWSVNTAEVSAVGPTDMIKYWRTNDRERAVEAQLSEASDPEATEVIGAMSVLRREVMPAAVSLAGIMFARAIQHDDTVLG